MQQPLFLLALRWFSCGGFIFRRSPAFFRRPAPSSCSSPVSILPSFPSVSVGQRDDEIEGAGVRTQLRQAGDEEVDDLRRAKHLSLPPSASRFFFFCSTGVIGEGRGSLKEVGKSLWELRWWPNQENDTGEEAPATGLHIPATRELLRRVKIGRRIYILSGRSFY